MDELVVWLRAQLDEDERTAREATHGPWAQAEGSIPHGHRVGTADESDWVAWTGAITEGRSEADARHIAEHDPARVLREIDAKRQILRALESAEVALRNTEPGKEPHELMTGAANSLRAAARMLATAYADRPGYKESWRP